MYRVINYIQSNILCTELYIMYRVINYIQSNRLCTIILGYMGVMSFQKFNAVFHMSPL